MFEKVSARDFVEEKLFAPFFRKEAQYIGIELELPILFVDRSKNSKQLGVEFLNELIAGGRFVEEKATCSPIIMRVNSKEGDSISFDYSYATIEFSMAKAIAIGEIADRFYRYLDLAVEFYGKHDCIISGIGTNPMMPNEIEYTRSNYTDTLRRFIENHCPQKDPKYYLLNMQSVQTHIEIPGKQLVEAYNVMCLVDFAKGLLLSNSLPDPSNLPPDVSYEANTLCARDFNWEGSGFPNTGLCDTRLEDIEHLIDYFTDKKLCFKRDGYDYSCFEPIALKEYFEQGNRTSEDLNAFFNVERVTINLYNVLEMRGDCTQPLSESFCPSAFNIGICHNATKAWQLTCKFLAENRLHTLGNRELRRLAITGRLTEMIPSELLSNFLLELLDVAKEGLQDRGLGELPFLMPLYERAETLSNPALRQLDMLAQGEGLLEIAKRYAFFR